MTSIRSHLFSAIIIFSLLLLAPVNAKRHSKQRRRQRQRHIQETNANDLAVRATKGGGSLAPAVPPLLPTLPPIPLSTKSPSRSSSSAPSAPKGPNPSPTPVGPDTTKTPTMVSSPTTPPHTTAPLPTVAGSTTGNSPAPSTSTGLVTPTEVEEEQSRTRALLPFSLDITNQPRVDEVQLGIQAYLYQRLTESFSHLESILLTVTNNDAQRRKLSMLPTLQQEQEQQERRVQEETMSETFNFTGVAMFYPTETLPTEVEVQRAQLKALEDFHRLNLFLSTVGGYDWQIEVIQLDGMVINQDGMKVGDSGTMENEGDTMVQESYQAQGGGSDNNSTVAISVSVTMVVLVGILVGFFVHRRRSKNTVDEPKETYQELIRSVDDLPKDLEPSPDKSLNVSFESVTVANTTFDSVQLPLADYGPSSPAGSNMDWNRVFALSQTPVEQTMEEVFEAKKLTPPKSTKIHEIVTLAPVTEVAQDGDDVTRDGEDSYGYDTSPEGHQDDFVGSSPVASPLDVEGGDDDGVYDFVRRGNHYNHDRDLTIDLADFNIDTEDDPK